MSAPELVVEIISPSNSRPNLLDKVKISSGKRVPRGLACGFLAGEKVTLLMLHGEAVSEAVSAFFCFSGLYRLRNATNLHQEFGRNGVLGSCGAFRSYHGQTFRIADQPPTIGRGTSVLCALYGQVAAGLTSGFRLRPPFRIPACAPPRLRLEGLPDSPIPFGCGSYRKRYDARSHKACDPTLPTRTLKPQECDHANRLRAQTQQGVRPFWECRIPLRYRSALPRAGWLRRV